jgi:hypothetical protein
MGQKHTSKITSWLAAVVKSRIPRECCSDGEQLHMKKEKRNSSIEGLQSGGEILQSHAVGTVKVHNRACVYSVAAIIVVAALTEQRKETENLYLENYRLKEMTAGTTEDSHSHSSPAVQKLTL